VPEEPNPEFACSVVRGIDSAVNSVTGAKEYPDAVHLRKVPLRKKMFLACPGHTGDPDTERMARAGQKSLEHALCLVKILGSITLSTQQALLPADPS